MNTLSYVTVALLIFDVVLWSCILLPPLQRLLARGLRRYFASLEPTYTRDRAQSGDLVRNLREIGGYEPNRPRTAEHGWLSK